MDPCQAAQDELIPKHIYAHEHKLYCLNNVDNLEEQNSITKTHLDRADQLFHTGQIQHNRSKYNVTGYHMVSPYTPKIFINLSTVLTLCQGDTHNIYIICQESRYVGFLDIKPLLFLSNN